MDKLKAQKQAKEILDKFAKALEEVKTSKEENFYVDREEFEREEGKGDKTSSVSEGSHEGLKKDILRNAPKKDNDFVIAEKGSWK